MDFLGIDKALAGLKRGAERFGGKIASRIVKRSEIKNGFAPKQPEPYGLGMGGADTEQMSQVPSQAENVKIGIEPAKLRQQNKLDFLKKELPLSQDKAEREAIEYEIAGLEKELSAMPTGDKDARQEKATSVSNDGDSAAAAQSGGNVDSSALGFESAEKTTTAHRDEEAENKVEVEDGQFMENAPNNPPVGARVKIRRDSGLGHKAGDTGVVTKDWGHSIDVKFDDPEGWRSPTGGWNAADFDLANAMENADRNCKLCEGAGVSDSGTACQACALKSVKNAGHLSPESWEAASLEERVQWLEKAGMDINLAPQHFTDLSQDVRVAIQDTHDMPSTVNNASGLQKHFVFRDANGEEETVEAADENAAWDKLAHDFATSLADLKAMGLKLVRTNEMENTSDTDTCSLCPHPKSNHSTTEPFCKANPNGKTCPCAGFVYSSADYPKRNDNPSGDLEEIARHAEGIEHEVQELAEEEASEGQLEFSNCAGKCGCAPEDHFADAQGSFKCPCNCEQCAALKKTNVLENKSMKNTNTTTCPECSKNGLIKHGEVWACPSCMGEFREGELLTNKGYEETRNSGVSRGSDKYGSKK